jgi:hypothetical protein
MKTISFEIESHQKLRRRRPRRTFDKPHLSDVQWRVRPVASLLLDPGCPNKVSMKKKRKDCGKAEVFIDKNYCDDFDFG